MKNRNDENTPILVLKTRVRDFIEKRNWQKYHDPKDIAIAISVEAAELLDIFKWRRKGYEKERIAEEIADVMIYLLSLANALNIDMTQIVLEKLRADEVKYPLEKPHRW